MSIESLPIGTKSPNHANRIFLYVNPKDFYLLSEIIEDLQTVDMRLSCVISYDNINSGAKAGNDELKNELLNSNLIIALITAEFVKDVRMGKIPFEIIEAKKFEKPILPIAIHDKLLEALENTEFGAVHALKRFDKRYMEHLKRQLNTLLYDSETYDAIREKAFSANLFLSYRKPDIDATIKFMQEFHSIEELLDIAIWFDTFLTAGQDFRPEIITALLNSDAVTLLVTPNMITKNSFVYKEEYRLADETNKPIVAVEAIKAKKKQFQAIFQKANFYVLQSDSKAVKDTFCQVFGKTRNSGNVDNESVYYLGMAYYYGIGVIRSLVNAAKCFRISASGTQKFSIESSEKLAEIFAQLFAYKDAIIWQERVIFLLQAEYGETCPKLAEAYQGSANLHLLAGDYVTAKDRILNALEILKQTGESEREQIFLMYHDLCVICEKYGDFDTAIEYGNKSLEGMLDLFGENHKYTSAALMVLGTVYKNKGRALSNPAFLLTALEYEKRALSVYEKTVGEMDLNYATACNNIGLIYSNSGNQPEALSWFNRSLVIKQKICGEFHPIVGETYTNLGNAFLRMNNFNMALIWYNKDLAICESIYGKEHANTATTLHNIAVTLMGKKEYKQSLDIFVNAFRIFGKDYANNSKMMQGYDVKLKTVYLFAGNKESEFDTWLKKTGILSGKAPLK